MIDLIDSEVRQTRGLRSLAGKKSEPHAISKFRIRIYRFAKTFKRLRPATLLFKQDYHLHSFTIPRESHLRTYLVLSDDAYPTF